MSLVIDASIGIQWVVRESGSARAVRLLDRSPIVPGLFFDECANILWKKVERKELSVTAAQDRAAALSTVSLDIVPDTDVFEHALALACELRHPAYDCIYIATARLRGVSLVTADRRLIEHCKVAGPSWMKKLVRGLDDVS